MTYFDQEKNEHYIPYVVEPSLGADRVTLAFLADAYDEEVVGQDKKARTTCAPSCASTPPWPPPSGRDRHPAPQAGRVSFWALSCHSSLGLQRQVGASDIHCASLHSRIFLCSAGTFAPIFAAHKKLSKLRKNFKKQLIFSNVRW